MSDDYNPYASPETPYSAEMGRGLGSGEYEFSPSQAELVRGLAFRMKFVGWFMVIAGVLGLFGGLVGGQIPALIQAIVILIVAGFTLSAAGAFTNIVTTSGSDIRHLMEALRSLRTLYSVQMVLIVVSLIAMVLLIIMLGDVPP